MSTGVGKKQAKPRILRWRGMLGDSSSKLRVVIAIVLVVASAVFTFTQLGFVSIDLPDGDSAYLVLLLQLVALGSLLLGTIVGTVIGLFAGVVLYLHACVLPLDHYEFTFVTPITSVLLLGLSGFTLGILFAFVLRKNPPQVRRIVYIAIVCFIVAALYSTSFVVNAFVTTIIDMSEMSEASLNASEMDDMFAAMFMRLGNVDLQVWVTTLLMTVLCCVSDYVARRVNAHQGALGLRTVFGAWLSVVVALSFMATAAVSFAVTSGDEMRDAEELMKSEVSYLCNQIQASNERAVLIEEAMKQGELDFDKIEEPVLAGLADLLEDRLIIDGYTTSEDGIIIVTVGDTIYASNDERFKEGYAFTDVFAIDTVKAIRRSEETDTLQRVVFDDPVAIEEVAKHGFTAESIANRQTYLAYLFAQSAESVLRTKSGEESKFIQHVIMIQPSSQVFAKRPQVMIWTTLSALVLMLGVYILVFLLLNRMIARRIDDVNDTLARVTAGDLDARVEVCDTREFESLSAGVNTTVDALKGWIAEAETRMDAELETAKAIQESALPRVFPPYPDILRFDIYATMQAAKQVGGDFYDFFLIGEYSPKAGKLGFIMADVSGKGVPAALFMMKAKTQIRDYLENGVALGEAVENANRLLCDGNDAGMFVTAWVGVLDFGTGHVDYVNAGHNPPLLWQYDGGWRWLKQKSGLPLGLFEGLPYKTYSVDCQVGDQFLLYTDGVTEAMDVNGGLYGEDRLEELVRNNYFLHPRQIVEAVRRDVAWHARGAERSDDITILALEVGVPPEVTATLTVPASVDQLPRVNEFIHNELDRRLCPVRTQNQLDIAVEELFVNVAHYAYPDATPENPGTVRVSYTYSAEPPSVRVDIADDGIPYNPLAKPDAVTPGDIMDVPIGGLGILMAKRSVDEMYYERTDSSNVVSIVKKW